MSKAVYVFESLGIGSLTSETAVQLLLFAARHKQDRDRTDGASRQQVILVAVDGDITGEELIRESFAGLANKDVVFQVLPVPKVPALGFDEQQRVYAVLEALKREDAGEIHFPDVQGYGYYLTLAKQCGVHLCDTTLVVHVVGSTLFSLEAEEKLVDSESLLLLDVLECGSTRLADVAIVHDRKAWAWYAARLPALPSQVVDISWTEKPRSTAPSSTSPAVGKATESVRVVFWGVLGQEAGLRDFCDAISAFLRDPKFPIEVLFVGQAKSIGAVDSVSYIRIRTRNWKVPVRIERNLSIPEELALVGRGDSIVFCDTSRREGLRARIYDGLGLPFILVGDRLGALDRAVPSGIVARMVEMRKSLSAGRPDPDVVEAWSIGRTWSIKPAVVAPLAPPREEPKISVVVTHFSRPDKLRFALESMKHQTYRNYEVIVVDDGSPDPKVVSELAAISREIEPLGWKLIRQENRYLGAARNSGARAAQGKYLLFMDDDNCARPEELATLAAVAERLGADVVTPFYHGFENDEDVVEDAPTVCFAPVGGDIAFAVFSPALGDANALYSREMFLKIGGYSEDYGITHEDWELHIRADLAGARRVTVPVPLFWYRVDPEGMYRNELMQLHRNANLRRHIRPFLGALPHHLAKLVQIAQGLSAERHRSNRPRSIQERGRSLQRPTAPMLPFARVAVIVRTKDRPVMLQRAVMDILAQTYGDWMMVVVNDGGDVTTLELVLEQFADQLANRVITINNPASLGMQTASNVGIDACDSDFIVIHDDDDTWKPEFLARTVAMMDQEGWNPRVAGVVTWSQVIVEQIVDGYDILETDRFIFNDRLYNLSLVDLGIENRFPPISFLFRRSAFEEVGRFREEFGVLGDWDFHLRMLERFDLEVIPEPLAGYHHRHEGTAGAYGNSVHAQRDVHIAKRMELVNSFVRTGDGLANNAIAQLLLHGQLYKNLENEQGRRFQKLHDHVWEVEQRLTRAIDGASPKKRFNLGRWLPSRRSGNLIENGDFRNWPGPGNIFATKTSSTGIICPGFLVAFDGRETTYSLERKVADAQHGLAGGKTYLRIVNKGQDSTGKRFWLECPIVDVDVIAGKRICVSGKARLQGSYEWMWVGGRIDTTDRGRIFLPEQKLFLTDDFEPWSCVLDCPPLSLGSVEDAQPLARIYFRLHYSDPFIFELTDVQAETGDKPSRFKYAGTRGAE